MKCFACSYEDADYRWHWLKNCSGSDGYGGGFQASNRNVTICACPKCGTLRLLEESLKEINIKENKL